MRDQPLNARKKLTGIIGSRNWKKPGPYASNPVTGAMSGKSDISAWALVPVRPFFVELGGQLTSAKAYLRTKEGIMDTTHLHLNHDLKRQADDPQSE